MIYFVVDDSVRWGIDDYLLSRGAALAPRVRTLSYQDLPGQAELPNGTYIFTQKDVLLPAELEIAGTVCRQLTNSPPARPLNDPSRILGRYELIRALHGRGLSEFTAVRATEEISRLRYPLFIREERYHTGSLTGLLHTRAELDRAMGNLLIRGWRRRDLLVVEFCDTRDREGWFRKFSAYVVGNEVIPKSVLVSNQWMVKSATKILNERIAREEFEYASTNPHEEWIREIFKTAGVEYGRMDYGFLNDRPQAWEINLFPTLVRPSWSAPDPSAENRALREPARALFFDRFNTALQALDVSPQPEEAVKIRLHPDLLKRLRWSRRRERLRTLHLRAFKIASKWRPLHPLWRAVAPLGSSAGNVVGRFWRPG